VIALPPAFAGGAKSTRTLALRPETDGFAGASGTVLGTAGSDATDGELVPSAFVAVTVHVYE
jgi:hypothetical protein